MSDPDYSPRDHDHLVEPLFGGLRGDPEPARVPPTKRGYLWVWLAALLAAGSLVLALVLGL